MTAGPAALAASHRSPRCKACGFGPTITLTGDREAIDDAENLERYARKLRQAGYAVHTAMGHGSPVQSIADLVNHGRADLLVMGAWGRSRLSELAMGGVTRWMLRNASLPLFLAH